MDIDFFKEFNQSTFDYVEQNPQILLESGVDIFSEVHYRYIDLLLSAFPEELKKEDVYGENILFYYHISDEYKQKLVINWPEAVKCICECGRNILFYDYIDDKYKQLLIHYWPDELARVDSDGRNILFFNTVKHYYKQLLLSKYPQSLLCIDKNNKSILFYDDVEDEYKQKLCNDYPHMLEVFDTRGYCHGIRDGELVRLPRKRVLENHCDGTCPICYCDFEIGDEVTDFLCKHDLHYECINMYMKAKGHYYVCYCKV